MSNKSDAALLPKSIANRWKGPASHISYGTEQLRFWWLGSGPRVSLDGWVENFSWDDLGDSAPVVTGSASLRQSLEHSPIPPLEAGDQLVMEIRENPSATWEELQRLRIEEPQRIASGQFTFQLTNDAALLGLGTDSWHFPHNKAHPNGWKPWQIVEEVCRRSRVRLVMPRIGKPIKKFPPLLNSSPIDVINAAMKHLRDTERRTLVRRFERSTIYMNERHYSPELMTLGTQIIDAALTATKRPGWATDLTVRTHAEVLHPKGIKGFNQTTHKGIVTNVSRESFIRRYGYVHLIVYAHGATSVAEARERGLQHLVRVLQPERHLTLTTPYIKGLRRGGYVRLAIPSLGLTQIVFVQGISFSASPGTLQMDVTVGFDDPQITPPLDTVNQSTKNLIRKPKNLKVNSSKMDKNTKKPYVAKPTLGGVTTK